MTAKSRRRKLLKTLRRENELVTRTQADRAEADRAEEQIRDRVRQERDAQRNTQAGGGEAEVRT